MRTDPTTLGLLVPAPDPSRSLEAVLREYLDRVWAVVTAAAQAVAAAFSEEWPLVRGLEVMRGELWLGHPRTCAYPAAGQCLGLCKRETFSDESGDSCHVFTIWVALGLTDDFASARASVPNLNAVDWCEFSRVVCHELAHVISPWTGNSMRDEGPAHRKTQRLLEVMTGCDDQWDTTRRMSLASGRAVTVPKPLVPLNARDLVAAVDVMLAACTSDA